LWAQTATDTVAHNTAHCSNRVETAAAIIVYQGNPVAREKYVAIEGRLAAVFPANTASAPRIAILYDRSGQQMKQSTTTHVRVYRATQS
jgi:hypothetical protein